RVGGRGLVAVRMAADDVVGDRVATVGDDLALAFAAVAPVDRRLVVAGRIIGIRVAEGGDDHVVGGQPFGGAEAGRVDGQGRFGDLERRRGWLGPVAVLVGDDERHGIRAGVAGC